MAGDGITAQTTDLKSAAPKYDVVSQQVAQIYQTLVHALDAEGACWGNDAQGATFGGKYCPPAVSAIQQMGNTKQGVQSMVDGICSWAKNYMNADQSASAGTSQIDPGTSTYSPPNYTGIDAAANSGG